MILFIFYHRRNQIYRLFFTLSKIDFKFHNLRHTYATILAESGVSPRYVQEMLGHSKLEFTLRYYTHVTEKMGILARNALETTVTFDAFNSTEFMPELVVN